MMFALLLGVIVALVVVLVVGARRAYDLAWLERCDALLRVPGPSAGADREVAHARERGLPTFFTVDGVIDWARGGR